MSAIPFDPMTGRQPARRQITGKHVLLIFTGFFGVMLAVNSLFVFFALSTFNGGEGSKAYQRGLDYNRVIEAARAQDALGWSHRLDAETPGLIGISITDKTGAPLAGLALSGTIGRPVAEQFTYPLAFREIRPGLYAASINELEPGNWVVTLAAGRGSAENIVYRAKERLWLQPNS
jgi:nitrogen fixation protein FixH